MFHRSRQTPCHSALSIAPQSLGTTSKREIACTEGSIQTDREFLQFPLVNSDHPWQPRTGGTAVSPIEQYRFHEPAGLWFVRPSSPRTTGNDRCSDSCRRARRELARATSSSLPRSRHPPLPPR